MNRFLAALCGMLSMQVALLSGCSLHRVSRVTAVERFQLLKGGCSSGDERAVQILLERGADPNGASDWKTDAIGGRFGDEFSSPMTAAAMSGHIDIMKLLLRYGAFIDVMEGEGHTPLSLAIYAKRKEAIAFLLSAGADASKPLVARTVAACEDSEIREMVVRAIEQKRPNIRFEVRQ